MATRNRTLIYKKYRDALKSVRVPSSSSPSSSSPSTSSGASGPVIELVSTSLLNPNRSYAPLSTEDPGNSSKGALTVGLPPAWVDVSEEIAANVQRARTKMAELTKAHAKALMPSFGDGKEDQRLIEGLTLEITNLIRKSEKQLQKLSAGGPSEDSNIRKNVQGQDGVDLEMNGSRSRMEDDDLDNMVFNEHQMAKLKKSEAFTVEREREIQQVVESVNELAQIMKDLSVLVIDQGTIVDRIDYNIQNVASTVEEGLKQLQKAERTQKKGGMVKCATVLIIMCFIMLVLLILKEIFL
ncbi:tlg2p-like protein a isoform X2 [Ziziphus jujuba]|uniref:Tlg2p-like protein a isoform X2 n=1 Tax=Ziziphus jujuba TaxID=326968 RepID=A0ABM3IAI5_ZIZJJ|nr:tlg2p-like protein a isoform X2 [Ziziphus jujuba]